MLEMGGQIGWGKFILERFEPAAKGASVIVFHSPFATAYGPSSKPVCHFIWGVLGGIFTGIFREEQTIEETHCAAQACPFCLFETHLSLHLVAMTESGLVTDWLHSMKKG